jgi:acyl-coenzyme A thioesterase 9
MKSPSNLNAGFIAAQIHQLIAAPPVRGLANPTGLAVTVPLATNPEVRRSYAAYTGGIRVGVLLEDVDALAGAVAYRHAAELSPVKLVTASVDKVEWRGDRPDPAGGDVDLDACITHQGRTSMEVSVRIRQAEEQLAAARLIFVARDAVSARSVPLPPLPPGTPEEPGAAGRVAERAARRAESRHESPAPGPDGQLVHDLLLGRRKLDPTAVAIADTHITTTVIMHPQKRNVHGTIFGGYLMRMAYETAWASAHMFGGGAEPIILQMDDIYFMAPVEIGSILRLDAHVVYSSPSTRECTVAVTAGMIDPISRSARPTNTMMFQFRLDGGEAVRPVIPQTYREAMRYLEGRKARLRRVNVDPAGEPGSPPVARE